MASGLQVVNVEEPGEKASEWLQQMAGIATKILEKQDLACLHIPFGMLASSKESSAQASTYVETLELIDERLLGPLGQSYVGVGEGRLFVVATPCRSQFAEYEPPTSRYVLSEGQKADGSPPTRAFDDQAVSTSPLQNASTFFERFFGKK
jgi:hypothetical protein